MKKKRIKTPEQKERYAKTRILKRANRTSEEVEKEKAKRQIYNNGLDKAQRKIYKTKWHLENKEDQNRQVKEWKKENPDYSKAYSKKFHEANPNYTKEWHEANPGYFKEYSHKHDLGYWVVYLIHDFDGLGNIYCGQTQNIHNRMRSHKSKGTLNSDKYELIKQCETRQDALEFEAHMHEQGYHGYNNGK